MALEEDETFEAEVDGWEIEEGLPQMEDPFIQRYLQGRDALIEQEKKRRSDYVFRQSLSPMARLACAIVGRIRDEERRTIWNNEYEDSLAETIEGELYPGMMFALAKERMEKTRLWEIVRRMPKGALLHAHMDAMVDVDWLLEKALATEGMHMHASRPLCTPAALETASLLFQFAKSSPHADHQIWSSNYQPSTLILLSAAADSFPNGGRSGFLAWLKTKCTITPHESLSHHQGPNAVWRKFGSVFPILNSIMLYEPIYRASVQKILQDLVEDGVRWVEFRLAFHFEYRREGSEMPENGYEECIKVFGEEIEKFKHTEKGSRFWGARMIYTALRVLDKRNIVTSMKQCIQVKKAYPQMIAGFDLVGQEDVGRPLADLTPELFWFRKRCVEEGVDIPFFFHAGECLGDGDDTDHNLFDAILLGTRRIGHGFSLYKHPLLIDMIKDKKILIESCPISNEVLRLTSSILSHPLPALLARGVSVALCNDDPAILGHGKSGLTHDYWQALQGWESLGLAGLGSLAENSIRWAAFADQKAADWVKDIKDGTFGQGIRAARMKEWNAEFEKYCQWIVMEYGPDYGSDGEE
ncbi:MAG: hypothetical protein M1830_003292 [Pleopsidium flavum]|nr:MAG: hypothetical protein M1830_003292 [Pleopsidium flavum]